MLKRSFAGFCLALVVLLGIFSEPVFAQISDMNSAINKAGRQRMLSQRMAKAYLQVGLNIDVERSSRQLDSSIALFDRQLVELKNYAPTPEIKNTYLLLEKNWLAYKDVLIGAAPSPDGARKVLELSETVLQLAHTGTGQLVAISGTETGPLVGVAGRQRMLSQRMAKYYQAIIWGVAAANGFSELVKDRKAFNSGLNALSNAPSTSPAIKRELELARQQWQLFEATLDAKESQDKKTRATNVAASSERLLDMMDSITGMFEKLSN
jgi:hypothetical protein